MKLFSYLPLFAEQMPCIYSFFLFFGSDVVYSTLLFFFCQIRVSLSTAPPFPLEGPVSRIVFHCIFRDAVSFAVFSPAFFSF